MTNKNKPAPTPPQKQNVSVNDQQVREACAAALEVLSGAQPPRIMELMDKLMVAKLLLKGIAAGEIGVGGRAQAVARQPVTPPPIPENMLEVKRKPR